MKYNFNRHMLCRNPDKQSHFLITGNWQVSYNPFAVVTVTMVPGYNTLALQAVNLVVSAGVIASVFNGGKLLFHTGK